MRKVLVGLLGACALTAVACAPPTGGGGAPPVNQAPNAVIQVDADSGVAHFNLVASGSFSSDVDGTITTYEWDFGDGNVASGAAVDNLYLHDGVYTVELTVTDDDGATDTATAEITVTDDPDGRYVASDGVNAGTCTDSGAPCLTVQYAVNAADASGDTVYLEAGNYPEIVFAQKDVSFKGANQGRSAGVDSGARRAESTLKGISSGATHNNPGTVARAINIDGLRFDPQGDATLMSLQNRPLVRLYGSAAGNTIENTVFYGGPLNAACGSTCTTMTDQAIWVQGGDISYEDNLFQNFRRAAWIYQTGASGWLVTDGDVTGNVFKDITSFAMRIAPAGGNPHMVGITVDGNLFDNSNAGAGAGAAGVNATTGDGNVITNNTFVEFSSSVFLYICARTGNGTTNPYVWYEMGPQTITGNDFVDVNSGVSIYVEDITHCTSVTDIDGTVINDNNFTGVRSDGVTPSTAISGTSLTAYLDAYAPIDATDNWYGTADGPNRTSTPTTGTSVFEHAGLVVSPWLTAAAP